MADVLLIGLNAADCETLAHFAQAYGATYDLLCLTEEPAADLGAERSFVAGVEPPPADSLAAALLPLCKEYRVVGGVSTMFGKDLFPRIAGLLDRPMVSDVVEVHGLESFSRPMFAGNITAKVQVDAGEFVVTVRGTAFANPARSGATRVDHIEINFSDGTKRLGVSETADGRPDLTQARVVVSGGRPLRDAETFEKLIGGLADALGGAVGATRAAVDSGIAPNELQVGQTGKIVAPELYIAAGISGSTQHIAGMKDSKVIVAINTDPEAPIFEIADYGLVRDLHLAIPELIEKLRR